ncbi:hypothetical protein D9611_014765 [Ephemerocybe angulata]|uniref:Uncharacterized protein n=1 Tax=Ephemerocybe angulata TaxID=980116 RepID=A0A8H5BRK3_9AGAR|nr:hypothetical protein D9611_014765 [Tulosesus angulatus]
MYKRAGCTTRLADSLVVGSAGLDDVAWPFVVVVVVIGALGFLDASIRWTDLRIRSRRSPELKIRGPTTYPRLYFERFSYSPYSQMRLTDLIHKILNDDQPRRWKGRGIIHKPAQSYTKATDLHDRGSRCQASHHEHMLWIDLPIHDHTLLLEVSVLNACTHDETHLCQPSAALPNAPLIVESTSSSSRLNAGQCSTAPRSFPHGSLFVGSGP